MFSQLFWQTETGQVQGEITAVSSKLTHPSRVCVVFCLRPVGYQICCWILYAIVSFKSRYVLNEKQLEMQCVVPFERNKQRTLDVLF